MQQNIDKKAVADSFSKAAGHYDQFAQLQRDIGEVLFNKIRSEDPAKIVDLGCGTGYFSKKLALSYPNALITCFDLSNAMLKQTKNRKIINAHYQLGDIDNLPFAQNSQDLIYSNLVVQWSHDLAVCLSEIKNSLKEGGKGYLSTLLNGTLNELTQAWKSVDGNPHTNEFLPLEVIQNMLLQESFSDVKIQTSTTILQYENVIEVMRALKGIGANHVRDHQAIPFSGRKLLKKLQEGYQPYKTPDGLLNLTYQVCYIEVTK